MKHLLNNAANQPFDWEYPTKLAKGIVAVGWCSGMDLEYRPNTDYLGMMVMDTNDDNNEYWTHVTPKQIAIIFGAEEGIKAKEICIKNGSKLWA